MKFDNIYLLDNFDSFSYNLVDEISQIRPNLVVYRNDINLAALTKIITNNPGLLVISPGPGTPAESGCLLPLLANLIGKVPILGICLGLQAIVQHFGGRVEAASEVFHGKTSLIELEPHPVFNKLPSRINVARYHSLVGYGIEAPLKIIAQYQGMPMAISHETMPIIGFQFHPESILTLTGKDLLKNTIEYLQK